MNDAVGALRARVTLQAPVRTQDDIGGAALTYADVAEVWAEIAAGAAGAADSFGALRSSASYRLSLRRRDDVRAGWRVRWGGRCFDVEAVRDEGARRIELVCTEEAL